MYANNAGNFKGHPNRSSQGDYFHKEPVKTCEVWGCCIF